MSCYGRRDRSGEMRKSQGHPQVCQMSEITPGERTCVPDPHERPVGARWLSLRHQSTGKWHWVELFLPTKAQREWWLWETRSTYGFSTLCHMDGVYDDVWWIWWMVWCTVSIWFGILPLFYALYVTHKRRWPEFVYVHQQQSPLSWLTYTKFSALTLHITWPLTRIVPHQSYPSSTERVTVSE